LASGSFSFPFPLAGISSSESRISITSFSALFLRVVIFSSFRVSSVHGTMTGRRRLQPLFYAAGVSSGLFPPGRRPSFHP
jgi:hypothetical protein